jgi:outer membrane biogenesis lipoprotein LolB
MMRTLMLAGAAALLLSACGEKPQDMAAGKKPDVPNWQGTDNAYVTPGWKAGDKAAWEEQLRTRTQQGQNEYQRVGGQS